MALKAERSDSEDLEESSEDEDCNDEMALFTRKFKKFMKKKRPQFRGRYYNRKSFEKEKEK